MNSSQPYQPLSHALNPTTATTRTSYPTSSSPYRIRPQPHHTEDHGQEDGILDPQLHSRTSDSPPSNIPAATSSSSGGPGGNTDDHDATEANKRRGPGRPKGSKTKKKVEGHQVGSSGRLPEVTEENKPYFEFQWRILNLCSEFYGAAEELVRSAPPNVIAQSYQMGPTSRVDPLVLLGEAKRIVDTLMANPHQLIMNPPPSIPSVQRFQSTSSSSFVLPLPRPSTNSNSQPNSHQSPHLHPSYPFYPGSGNPSAAVAAAVASIQSSTAGHGGPSNLSASNSAHAQGAREGQWSEEEVESLKNLAENSRAKTNNGEIDWDYVVSGFGGHRTRHQVLIKGTLLGLKESSSKSGKGNSAKRKREEVEPRSIPGPPSPADRTISPQQPHQTQPVPTMYPMPVMPVADRPSSGQDVGGSSFYRPRPASSGEPTRPTSHPYMYPSSHER